MEPEVPQKNSSLPSKTLPNRYSEDDTTRYSGDVLTDHSSLTDLEDLTSPLQGGGERLREQLHLQDQELRQLREELLEERRKSSKMEKKLNFVKENQEVFVRLKEAYISMKYNEAAGRRMIEIRQKGVQTWEGAICPACVETEALRREFECLAQKYSQLYLLTPSEMERLLNTVKYLKDLVERREEGWKSAFERECHYQSRIALLESENEQLRHRNLKIFDEIPEDATTREDSKLANKTVEKMRKIIVKYEKHFSDVNECQPGRWISPLNDKETKLVHEIVTVNQTSNVIKPAQTSPLRFPASHVVDAAILKMDQLFD